MKRLPTSFRRQAGATLLVGMIMLILMTLLALGAIRLANTHLKVVGNEQIQQEGQAAAQFALDFVANSPTFSTAAGPQTITANVGVADYSVTVAKPYCRRYRAIPIKELVTVSGAIPTINAKDIPCITGSSSSGLSIADASAAASTAGDSLCAGALWELEATAVPAASSAQTGVVAVITEGIEQRVTVAEALTACK